MEIVGVCDDVKQFRLDADPTADVYVPLGQMPSSQTSFLAARMYWVLNTDVDPMAVADLVRGQVRRLDKDVATSSTRAMSAIVALSIGSRRFNTHPHGNRRCCDAAARAGRGPFRDHGGGDLAVIASAVMTLGAAALVASYLPARRAAHADPLTALRQ